MRGFCIWTVTILAVILPQAADLPAQSKNARPAEGQAPIAAQKSRKKSQSGKLDPSGTFFEPPLSRSKKALVRGDGVELGLSAYHRFLVASVDRRLLEEFAFTRLVALECKRLRLARTAPLLARSNVVRIAKTHGARLDGVRRRAAENAELLRLRIDALVRHSRKVAERDLRLAFDTKYGLDGVKVEVQQVLVSRTASRKRLETEPGPKVTDATVMAYAASRASALYVQAMRDGFAKIVPMSDDPTTRTLAASARTANRAAVLENYDYQRYGTEFAKAVRALEVGQISKPVKTSFGFHIIQLLSRKVTKFEEVAPQLRAALRVAPANEREKQLLRERLFKRYKIQIAD